AAGRLLRRLLAADCADRRDLVVPEGRPASLARERPLDIGRELGLLSCLALGVTRLEGGQDGGGEQLQGSADMRVLVSAALLQEHHLVDAGLLKAPHVAGNLIWRADATSAGRHRQEVAGLLVIRPDARAAGDVLAEDVVVAER